MSARPYLREREAWSNLSQFVAAVPVAPVPEVVRDLTSRPGRGRAAPRTLRLDGGVPTVVRIAPDGDLVQIAPAADLVGEVTVR